MNLRLSSALCVAAIGAIIGSAGAYASEFAVGDEPLQEIRGWGVTPAPMDWDGRIVLHAEARKHVEAVYRDSGLSMIRLLIGATNVYNNEQRQARPGGIDWALEDQVKLALGAGVREYVITLLSAPVYMKKYYASASHLQSDPNPLRGECEELFASYVADILDRLREKGLAAPKAVSIQMQPDNPPADWGIPVTAAHGTAYTAGQWWRVALRVRAELDRRGHREVGLIGPETFGPAGWRDWAAASEFKAAAEHQDDKALAGWAYNSDGVASPADTPMPASVTAILERMRSRNAVWMLAANCNRAENDAEMLVLTFQGLRRDLVDVGASYWFWRYVFDWRASSEVLVSGRGGNRAPVYHALAALWKATPPGARVHRLRREADSGDSLDGFALVSPGRTICVCCNPGRDAAVAVFRGLSGNLEIGVFGAATSPTTSRVAPATGHRVSVPARSVAIVIAAGETR